MKFLRLLVNIAVGVGLFYLFGLMYEKFGTNSWPPAAIMGGVAAVGFLFRNSSSFVNGLFNDFFHYGLVLAAYGLIIFVSFSVLPSFEYNTFFKGFLLFLGSAFVLCILARFFLRGLRALIDFGAWGENPAHNMTRIAFAFVSLLAGINWIAGVAQCGLAGGLSILGLLVGFVPSEYMEAMTETVTETEPDFRPYREEITLSNGVTLKENDVGMMMDSSSHEWKQDRDGNWYDDGFRL